MPLNLASPGIVVREVDLTIGRIDPASDKVGAIVAPFAQGPVSVPTIIDNENELLANFGKPYNTDKHYEHWLVASSYLAYGGPISVVRSDDADLKNAYAGSLTPGTGIKIKSNEHYNQLGYDENTITGVTVVAKNPGSWANDLKIAIIDGRADQILSGVRTDNVSLGSTVAQNLTSSNVAGVGTVTSFDGELRGVVTEILSGNKLSVKVVGIATTANTQTVTNVDYQQGGLYKFATSGNVRVAGVGSTTYTAQQDWFDQQTIELSNSAISWNTIADTPGTSAYAAARGGRYDEVHVVVIDDKGGITGNAGTILEKHIGLSKAKDGEFSVGSPSYWRKYLQTNSGYIFAGSQPAGIVTTGIVTTSTASPNWDQNATGVDFGSTGNNTLTLLNGVNYNGQTGLTTSGALTANLSDITAGYELFANNTEIEVDFLMIGSGNRPEYEQQALANKLIAVAEERKDAIAFVSPHRLAFLSDASVGTVTVNDAATITNNLISFYSPITSSSYGIFDSGYKYMYDRFNNTFRYIPLNGDMAGLCARNDINNFPWYSPAGTTRGTILNAVKLAYNPNKAQRDKLYTNRINPVVFSPGSGIILFGDKTALAKQSAFDRINVRRLFIYLEDAISAAAKDQLFEFNDEITRTNFVNIIEPFLRDVQAKRGINDFVVICDETNNTAAVIDNNEFVADIYIKPARSINFIGLTFVATRTGVAFEEVIGTV